MFEVLLHSRNSIAVSMPHSLNGFYIEAEVLPYCDYIGCADMPKEYIYEPWTAPEEVQRKARCVIGKDYPKPGMQAELLVSTCDRTIFEVEHNSHVI